MSDPRPSRDEETAPLLDQERRNDSFFSALTHPTRKLTNLEKLLGLIAILFLLLASTFIGLFAGAQHKLEKGKDTERWHTLTVTSTTTRTTPHTVSSTIGHPAPTGKPAQILQSLNTSVDPCDDFYQFATGGWRATHAIPADRGLTGAFNEVADGNKKLILKVLDSIPANPVGSEPEVANLRKLKSFYESCKDVDKLNDLGGQPLIPLVDALLELFGPFDLIPAPELDAVEAAADWSGQWSAIYEVPRALIESARKATAAKTARTAGGTIWDDSVTAETLIGEGALLHEKPDEERREKITKTLAWLHSRGVDALVNFNIEGDAGGEDSQVQSLWLYQAFGGLPSKEYYQEKPILDLYSSVIQGILVDITTHKRKSFEKRDVPDNVLHLAEQELEVWPWPWPGDDDKPENGPGRRPPPTKDEPVEERMKRLAAKVVHFERELVRAGADPERLFNPHYAYNPYSTGKVGKHLPFLDIPTYLSAFAIRSFPENITVTHPSYLKAVSSLVDNTPDYVLSAYFTTRLALSYAPALGPKSGVRAEARRLEDVLKGIKKGTEENREDVCLNWVDNVVGFIAGREFIQQAFSPQAKKEGEDIINSIVQAFHDKLPHISWMDKASAKAAQKKAEAIIPKVGYPLTPNTTDPVSLASWYSQVRIEANDFFGNVLRSSIREQGRAWAILGRKRDRQTWETQADQTAVNAYYSPPDGEIVFPAGILQPPFYSQVWPAHMKYGAFGAVAAHELTHAFDNSGSQYDEKGRLREWWTNGTIKAFEERAQCVAKQYSKFYVHDDAGNKVFVNGNVRGVQQSSRRTHIQLTNGEDIADSGLAQAYTAWKSTAGAFTDVKLPGLDYTDDQLFFIAFGRIWAQLARPATEVSRVRTDPHSPPYWRVVGTLRNLDAFHKAFHCKAGSAVSA